MIQLNEADKITVWDMTLGRDIGPAVAFIRTKYNCSEDEAVVAVDNAIEDSQPLPDPDDTVEHHERWDGQS